MNNITFTSKINFVDARTFEKFQNGVYIDCCRIQNFSKDSFSEQVKNKIPKINLKQPNKIYTYNIRTCTAGGIIDSKTGEAVGFHIYDDLCNLKQIKNILEEIFNIIKNPDRAFLLGGKNLKCSPYSIPIFNTVYNEFLSKIKNITLFQEHVFPLSESDFHYNLLNDTWTLHTMYRPLNDAKEHSAMTPQELRNCFKRIELANGDSLYINNEKIDSI